MSLFVRYVPVSLGGGGGGGITTGDLTDIGTDGIVITNGTGAVVGTGTSIAQHVADTTHNGYLSSADWNTFSGKQDTVSIGNFSGTSTAKGLDITAGVLTLHAADATNPGALSVAAQSFAGIKTFVSAPVMSALTASQLVVTDSGKALASQAIGNLTAAGTDGIAITGGTGSVIGTGTSVAQQAADATHNGYLTSANWSTFNGKQAAGNYITALTGDGTASGPGSAALTLAATQNNITSIPNLVTVGTLTSGTWSATTIALNKGGTGQTTKAAAFDALSPMTTGGDIIYGGASGTGTRLANGSVNQYLASGGGTAAPVWTSFVAPTVQTITATGAGTYTLPSSPRTPLYIRVRLVGAGGGGGGSGSAAGSSGGTGGTTFFRVGASPDLLVGVGGNGGGLTGGAGGSGGTASLGSGPVGIALQGGGGAGGGIGGGVNVLGGSTGGSSAFGGGAAGSGFGGAGSAAPANTGGGAGGGGSNGTATVATGGGGGAGGFVDAIITSPASSYSYSVGVGGTAGSAGTSGLGGGVGGSGLIIVEEYYQ